MIQLYIDCPFCCNNIDLYYDIYPQLSILIISDVQFVSFKCENCKGKIIILSKDLYRLSHREVCKEVEKCKMEGLG